MLVNIVNLLSLNADSGYASTFGRTGMCPFSLTNLPYVKCNIVLPLDVVQLDSLNGDYGSRGQPSQIVIKLKLTALEP